MSEDSLEAQNNRANAIAKHSTADEIAEEETKKVIEAISCENNCQTAKQAKFSKNWSWPIQYFLAPQLVNLYQD